MPIMPGEECLRISIEVAHPTPGSENLGSLATALAIGERMSEQGHHIGLSVFVDDILASQRPAGRFWQAMGRGRGEQLAADLTDMIAEEHQITTHFNYMQESDMIEPGRAIAEELMKCAETTDGVSISQGENSVKLRYREDGKRKSIKIYGYGEHADLPSCEVMDLACYQHKTSRSELAVTVIDEGYRGQQERTKKLAELLGWELPVITVFVDANGNTVDILYWSKSVDPNHDASQEKQ